MWLLGAFMVNNNGAPINWVFTRWKTLRLSREIVPDSVVSSPPAVELQKFLSTISVKYIYMRQPCESPLNMKRLRKTCPVVPIEKHVQCLFIRGSSVSVSNERDESARGGGPSPSLGI